MLSSLHEGFGIVLQEAMQVGLPIVSTNIGGQTDFLVEGENALLMSPEKPEAMSKAIARLLCDAGLRDRMATKNKQDVGKFDVKEICQQYLNVVRSL